MYLMIAVRYVHMVRSMLHVNAMRMDEANTKQKNTKMQAKKRHSSNAILVRDAA